MRRWLEVSSHRDVPPILLLWSRCVSMIPAARLQPSAAPATAAAPRAAEARTAEPSISLAAVADPHAAAKLAEEQKEAAAAEAAPAAPAADVEPEAEALRKAGLYSTKRRRKKPQQHQQYQTRHSHVCFFVYPFMMQQR